MYHSITFGDKNTWDDWHLFPSSRPVFNPPLPKTIYIDIPGADWHLDMSKALTGEMTYEGRTGSFEFIVDNGHAEWYELYSEIMDYLHGQTMRATLEDDPSYFYEGCFSVNKWKSDPHNSKIIIDYNVAPYKFELSSSLEDWLWDPFNFETGIIREYKNLAVNKMLVLTIDGNRKPVVPVFIVQSEDKTGLKVEFNGVIYSIPDGTSRVMNIVLKKGENTLIFTGKGTVSVDYRGGRL